MYIRIYIFNMLCKLFVQRTAGFDLYIVFDPLIAKSQAILLGNKLIRWINVSIIYTPPSALYFMYVRTYNVHVCKMHVHMCICMHVPCMYIRTCVHNCLSTLMHNITYVHNYMHV